MDVTFPIGVTYMVVFDTDAYSGNFERELTAYAAGAFDDEGSHGEDEFEAFLACPEQDLTKSIARKVRRLRHGEYGDVSNAIRPTPGRVNIGGTCVDAADGVTGWNAYESVACFFSEPLTDDEMNLIRARAHEYAAAPTAKCGTYEPFTIKDIYQVRVTSQGPVEERL